MFLDQRVDGNDINGCSEMNLNTQMNHIGITPLSNQLKGKMCR